VVLACTHFPWSRKSCRRRAPAPLAFVDGKEGIARRVAFLTRDVGWPAAPGEGVAVFTGPRHGRGGAAPRLARYGLTRIEFL
jgi:glutamate racemase